MAKIGHDHSNCSDRIPIVIPLGAGILALIAGIVIAVFCLFAAIVIGFAAVVMVGVVLFAAGIGSLFANPGVGLAVLEQD